MNKEKLLALLAKKEARKAELATKADGSEDVEELRSINTELDELNEEIRGLNEMIAAIPEERSTAPIGNTQILGTYGMGGKAPKADDRTEDRLDSMEYRKAFMDYVLRGVKSPALEFRTDATAATTDISAVIPTTIMNKVVEKMTEYGRIFARVSKTNIRGGVEIPTASLKPTASWISEGSVAEKQKKTITGKISFSYYKLQVRVAVKIGRASCRVRV